MANWENADTLAAYKKLLSLKGQVNLKEVLDADRVKNFQVSMAAGLTYNYAAKEVNAQILSVLQELADEAELCAKFKELYEGAVINTGENRKVLHHLLRGQLGADVEFEGKTYTPDMVMGPERKGLKVTYCTDTRPLDIISQKATDADLFICEGMYGDPAKAEDAVQKRHMTFYEAAELGKAANPKRMWLTHYSPSLVRPEPYMDKVKKIFANAIPGKDGMSVDLLFED